MPFLPNFNELKGFANSLNPLNVFAEQPNTSTPSTPNTAKPPSAVAGPGPSTLAAAQNRSSTLNIPSSDSRPIRPSLKNGAGSSISSFEDEAGRRRSSGNSVVIVDPVDGEERERRRIGEVENGTARRKPRPVSVGTAVCSVNGDTARRRKKAPLDTYIVVKPPPTSSKNPLNLQIQLVVKDVKTRDRSVSGVSTRSASVSTDFPSSQPVTPTTPNIDLPAPGSESNSQTELSSSADSKSRSDSPAAISSDEADQDKMIGSALRRTSSVKSNGSSNTSSTTLSGGGKKRVEPMFNLTVHNVMQPTVVTDASTDVKVAKFLKRSLDVTGVGILEPCEVWLPPSNTPSAANLAASSSNEDTPQPAGRNRPLSFVSLTTPLSPTATRASDGGPASNIRNSLDLSLKKTSIELKNLRIEVGQEGGAKKFFGKIFKKKPQTESNITPAESRKSLTVAKRSPSPASSNGDTITGQPKSILQHGNNEHASHTHTHATFGTAPLIVHRRSSGTIVTPEGAVTGLTAVAVPAPSPGLSVSPPTASYLGENVTTLPMLPSTRPVGYSWAVKKWAKRNSEGWAAHLVAAAAAGLDMVHGAVNGEGEDEVVFEWVKLRLPSNAVGSSIMRKYSNTGAITNMPGSKQLRVRKPKSRTASIRGDVSPAEPDLIKANHTLLTPDVQPTSLPPSPNPSLGIDPRPQPVRRVSASVSPSRRNSSSPPSIAASTEDEHDNSSVHTNDMTAEEDSDPEDSETPWICSVWVKKTGQRQLLGTLTPAPHHPKVIAALKIPRCLDSVSLTEVREGSSPAQAEMASKVKQEVCLTEENLKDVVCVTAMWLVAREEFGGLGRKKRHSKV